MFIGSLITYYPQEMFSPLSITIGHKREIFLSLCQSKTQTYHVGKLMFKSILNISDIKFKHAELRSNAKSLNDQIKRTSPVTNSDYDCTAGSLLLIWSLSLTIFHPFKVSPSLRILPVLFSLTHYFHILKSVSFLYLLE